MDEVKALKELVPNTLAVPQVSVGIRWSPAECMAGAVEVGHLSVIESKALCKRRRDILESKRLRRT